ncbi:hypothetical protein SAMN05192551_11076 [Tindallia magadiensis]|uniref:Uncharacterized protein n=1 Tax=Tindallia magadiensis TaxID=69895 RepID=A0A1I3GWP9_9FIRM|nr:hypothetical protein [Tindallia magadiensis]SFI27801.1 hypothetical protein SAMN05192551_11076 [Tindallia magadiensis]
MRKHLIGGLNIIFWTFQTILLIGVMILEDLSGKRMGVQRHVLHKESIYGSTYFTPELMRIYMGILIVLSICTLLLFTYSILKKKNNVIIKWSITTAAISLSAFTFILTTTREDFRAYHYFLMALLVVVGLHYLRLLIGIISYSSKHTKNLI